MLKNKSIFVDICLKIYLFHILSLMHIKLRIYDSISLNPKFERYPIFRVSINGLLKGNSINKLTLNIDWLKCPLQCRIIRVMKLSNSWNCFCLMSMKRSLQTLGQRMTIHHPWTINILMIMPTVKDIWGKEKIFITSSMTVKGVTNKL